jgi:O-antigen/teichoic acid export membrane protein
MSRTRKAAVPAVFSYAQFALAIVTGIVLVPMILAHVGARAYGLWLASGEILSHAGMIDLGVLGIMPWLVAEADGARDRERMRRVLVAGVSVGAGTGLAFAAVAAVLWRLLPSMLWLTPADRALVGPPLAALAVATAVGYPLRGFQAVLAGLQDVFFNGLLAMAQGVLGVVLTVVLLLKGYGLWALAWSAAISLTAAALAALVRVVIIAPDLVRAWRRPTMGEIHPLLSNGIGVWLGAMGWRLISATNGLVITYMGHPESVAIYACTAKIASMSTQLAWVLPDSGLVGLAQLYGEGQPRSRIAGVIHALTRLHLLLAGGAACGVLAFNASFVRHWVGPDFFGGFLLNALLGAGIVVGSFGHGLITAASVVGSRLRAGMLSMANGVVQPLLAVYLGHRMGLAGVALAALVAALVTSVPVGLLLIGDCTGEDARRLVRDEVAPWVVRAAPLAALAVLAGALHLRLGLWANATVMLAICAGYVWQMRPLYSALPLGASWTRWLAAFRLVPSAAVDRP